MGEQLKAFSADEVGGEYDVPRLVSGLASMNVVWPTRSAGWQSPLTSALDSRADSGHRHVQVTNNRSVKCPEDSFSTSNECALWMKYAKADRQLVYPSDPGASGRKHVLLCNGYNWC